MSSIISLLIPEDKLDNRIESQRRKAEGLSELPGRGMLRMQIFLKTAYFALHMAADRYIMFSEKRAWTGEAFKIGRENGFFSAQNHRTLPQFMPE